MQQWELQPWKQSRRLDSALTSITFHQTHRDFTESAAASVMSWLFLDWFVPLYLLVSVLVLAGFGACLYFLEPGLQDAHKWSSKTVRHHPLVASVNCRDDDSNALI
ncbi:serine hydrolase [Solea senegalensis]|uniref:Serine hydrolase n=1 Tax=Solea senegalensis TaxID=28829 RepID=A0AAV6Q6D4_SOLSE|nr:serine hydrolase [Solea senegalensis]